LSPSLLPSPLPSLARHPFHCCHRSCRYRTLRRPPDLVAVAVTRLVGVVIIALAAINLFVALHPRRRRHRKADCCIIVTVASWIDDVVIIASPP
jgi:hypothetical protein